MTVMVSALNYNKLNKIKEIKFHSPNKIGRICNEAFVSVKYLHLLFHFLYVQFINCCKSSTLVMEGAEVL